MPIRIAHTVDYALPARIVAEAMSDPESIIARSRRHGMRITAVGRTGTPGGGTEVEVRFTSNLPRAVSAIIPDDFHMCRRERWTPGAGTDGGTSSRVEILFPLLPVTMVITGGVRPVSPDTSAVDADCLITVTAPFVGRYCERAITDFYWGRSKTEPGYIVDWMTERGLVPEDTTPEDILTFHDRVEHVEPTPPGT